MTHLPTSLLSVLAISVLAAAAPTSNSFAAQIDPALIASNKACAAAVAQVQSDPLVTQCFGADSSLFFATQNMICDGEAYPGAPDRNPRCLAATVNAARVVSDKCPAKVLGDGWGTKELVYKAWSNRQAARDACTLLRDPLADPPGNAESHTLVQVYQSFNTWRNWKWDTSVTVPVADKRKVLCTPANKVYWRNIKVVGEQPVVYFMVLGDAKEVGEYVSEVAGVCGFKVPAGAVRD